MNNENNIILYGTNLFGENTLTTNQKHLKAIQDSGFNRVILWSLHVHSNGDFYYNDTLAIQNGVISKQLNPELPSFISELKSAGTVEKVFFCIGSWDAAGFQAIKNLLASPEGTRILQRNFRTLLNTIPVDGFDFDLEAFPLSSHTDTVVALTLMLKQQYGMLITYAPYCEPDFWLNCLIRAYQQNKQQQPVSWLNLQCYAGGSKNNPEEWIGYIRNRSHQLGISDSEGFIVPGYWARHTSEIGSARGDCPTMIYQKINALDVKGCFIWQSTDIFNAENDGLCGPCPTTPAMYAKAITDGIKRMMLTV